MTIALRQLKKRLGARQVLRDVTLEVQRGELLVVLGPSGSGKTTLLRLLAGFLTPDAGEIWFGDRLMNTVPAHLRQVAMVFQHPALWPHLTAAENIGYGLDVRGVPNPERHRRIAEALTALHLDGLADCRPEELSGGQQQRVALARALVIRPQVILLDEPLSHLDPPLRTELRDELRRIHAEVRLTVVYVTHDQREALSLGDRAAVLHDGVIEQLAPPAILYRRPDTRFVADFLGEMNWIEGEVVEQATNRTRVQTCLGFWLAPATARPLPQHVWVGFRPRHVNVGELPENSFSGSVQRLTSFGEFDECLVRTANGQTVRIHLNTASAQITDLLAVTLSVNKSDLIIVPRS